MSQDQLTPKQQRFVQEYLVDLNGKQAAIRTGYSEKTAEVQASRLLSNAKVALAVASAQAELAERTEITQGWVLQSLKSVADRCMQVEPVFDRKGDRVLVENTEGDMVPAFVFNAAGANRSLELLGKHIGMFTEKVKHEGGIALTGGVSIYLPDNGRK